MPLHGIAEHFPHEEYRPGQERAICEAIDAIESKVENIVIEGATGVGKTPIIITVARYMTSNYDVHRRGLEYMLNSDDSNARGMALEELSPHQAHIITNMKMLQRQYLKDDRSIVLMMGKGNYDCDERRRSRKRFSCQDSELVYNSACKKCVYKEARKVAQAARLTLHNFDSFFNQAALGQSFMQRKLLCLDEAHDLEEKVISVVSFSVDDATIERMFPDLGWHLSDLTADQAVEKMPEISQMFERKKEEIGLQLDSIRDRFGVRPMDDESQARAKVLSQNKQFCEDTIRKTSRFVDTKENIDWAIEKEKDGFSFEPVSGRPFVHHAVLKFGDHKLFTSATFLDPQTFCNAVKIKHNESKYISVPCTFPVRNRRIVPVSVGNMGQRSLDENWPRAVLAINKLADLHKGARGVIHATSYALAKRLSDEMNVSDAVRSRLVFHESRGRDDTINSFMHGSDRDAILVGVSVTQGYDFKGEMCEFQIITRLPFPYPSERIKKRKDIDPRYYDWRTALSLVQTCGRGNRSPTDRCVTYVLDSRFDRFVSMNDQILPQWWKDAITRR